MASVIVVYCLVIPLIWDLDSYGEEMFFLSLVIGLTTPLGMAAMLMVAVPKTQFAGRLGIVIYLLVVGSFCVAIWHPGGWPPIKRPNPVLGTANRRFGHFSHFCPHQSKVY